MESDSKRKQCTVVVSNEDEANPAIFKGKWGEDDLPVVDQYNTYLGVEISKDCWIHTERN